MNFLAGSFEERQKQRDAFAQKELEAAELFFEKYTTTLSADAEVELDESKLGDVIACSAKYRDQAASIAVERNLESDRILTLLIKFCPPYRLTAANRSLELFPSDIDTYRIIFKFVPELREHVWEMTMLLPYRHADRRIGSRYSALFFSYLEIPEWQETICTFLLKHNMWECELRRLMVEVSDNSAMRVKVAGKLNKNSKINQLYLYLNVPETRDAILEKLQQQKDGYKSYLLYVLYDQHRHGNAAVDADMLELYEILFPERKDKLDLISYVNKSSFITKHGAEFGINDHIHPNLTTPIAQNILNDTPSEKELTVIYEHCAPLREHALKMIQEIKRAEILGTGMPENIPNEGEIKVENKIEESQSLNDLLELVKLFPESVQLESKAKNIPITTDDILLFLKETSKLDEVLAKRFLSLPLEERHITSVLSSKKSSTILSLFAQFALDHWPTKDILISILQNASMFEERVLQILSDKTKIDLSTLKDKDFAKLSLCSLRVQTYVADYFLNTPQETGWKSYLKCIIKYFPTHQKQAAEKLLTLNKLSYSDLEIVKSKEWDLYHDHMRKVQEGGYEKSR